MRKTAICVSCYLAWCGMTGCAADRRAAPKDPGDATAKTASVPEWMAQWAAHTTVTMTEPWKAGAVLLYRRDGSAVPLEARSGVYRFHFAGSTQPWQDDRGDATAFVDPATGRAFAGSTADYYLETPDGIKGISLLPEVIRWFDSEIATAKPGGTPDDLVHRYERGKDYFKLHEGSSRETDLRDFVRWDFFSAVPGASNPGPVKVNEIKLREDRLSMRLESPTGAYHATIHIDTRTEQVVRASNEGKRVFPKRGGER